MIDPLAVLKPYRAPSLLRYYDVDAAWPRIEEAFAAAMVQDILERDLGLFLLTSGLAEGYQRGTFPMDYAGGWGRERNGEIVLTRDYRPFWQLVIPGATLWLVNSSLAIAKAVEPECQWRIIEGVDYAAVWDGKHILFDPHGLALGLEARHAWKRAAHHIHPVGHKRRCQPCCERLSQTSSLACLNRFVEAQEPRSGILLF